MGLIWGFGCNYLGCAVGWREVDDDPADQRLVGLFKAEACWPVGGIRAHSYSTNMVRS